MSCARLQAFDPTIVDRLAELRYTVSMNEYDKSKFEIDDLYDIISRELEEQKREREKYTKQKRRCDFLRSDAIIILRFDTISSGR